jgi:hypothetical protein
MLTTTKILGWIPGAKGKTWHELEKEHPLLRQGNAYIARLFEAIP